MVSTPSRPRKALIIGAGPVGSLTALSLHRRGWDVEIWESRDDPRGQDITITNLRSINLAISARGLEALRSVDPSLAEDFLQEAIPMKGRMIHHVDGRQESQLYDPIYGQCINSISRPILNLRLVKALPKSITTRFRTKLSRIDFKTRLAYALVSDDEEIRVVPGEEHGERSRGGKPMGREHDTDTHGYSKNLNPDTRKDTSRSKEDSEGTPFDLVIGCDGSWSKVRSEMMRTERVDFSQSFIPHTYIELHMPAVKSKSGGFAIDKNHLHIWPRHSFMLIGLPNKDGSFTLTLFIPYASLAGIVTEDQAAKFFRDNFPSAVQIVGEKDLVEGLLGNPRGSLVTINANPSYWSSHALLLGDASHSMVPFYGQGLNCGLEDVRVLNAHLERHAISATTTSPPGAFDKELEAALKDYSSSRHADLTAICELALQNYAEMRSHVLSPLHHLRRHLDTALSTVLPSSSASGLSLTNPFPTERVKGWTSLYEMVTFRPDVGYAEALRREKWQKGVVGWVGWGLGLGVISGLGVSAFVLGRKIVETRY